MTNKKLNNQPSLIEHVEKNYKQASVLSNDPEQGLVINAILNTDGGIDLESQNTVNSDAPSLTTGHIREQQLNQNHFLALLLDADDVSALIESNVEYLNTPNRNPLLFNANNKTILKIEDVLHEDDSLDEYLPPDNDRWLSLIHI